MTSPPAVSLSIRRRGASNPVEIVGGKIMVAIQKYILRSAALQYTWWTHRSEVHCQRPTNIDVRMKTGADAAARQGLSESAFLKRLVERALAGTDSVSASVLPSAWRSRNSKFGVRWSALMDTCERGWIFEHNLAVPGPAHCGGPVRERFGSVWRIAFPLRIRTYAV